jgi:hypothetical protein
MKGISEQADKVNKPGESQRESTRLSEYKYSQTWLLRNRKSDDFIP